jgi:hypothetical protein
VLAVHLPHLSKHDIPGCEVGKRDDSAYGMVHIPPQRNSRDRVLTAVYEEVHGLTTTRRGDNWDTDAFRSVEAMTQYESSDSEFAQPKAWKAFLKTFTSIFELPVEKSEIQRISERYFRDFEDRYSEQNLPLRPNDLPSLDEVRREVEKVER